MCGPVTHCCCCFPLRGGLRLFAVLLILLEVLLAAHNVLIVTGNTDAFVEALDIDDGKLHKDLEKVCVCA